MITKEKLEHHIAHLQEKHDQLDADIIKLEAQHTDHLKVETMKKLKLHARDEIEKFKLQLKNM